MNLRADARMPMSRFRVYSFKFRLTVSFPMSGYDTSYQKDRPRQRETEKARGREEEVMIKVVYCTYMIQGQLP